jgi:hypothetical protein
MNNIKRCIELVAGLKTGGSLDADFVALAGAANKELERLGRIEQERDALKDAVAFYAKRYHDENHISDTYLNCVAETCLAAAALKGEQA